jgi:ubiquinone/menaquinone biosynthesis C-methylase UbiE
MKDNFSDNAKQYAQFRPGYPLALVEFLCKLSPRNKTAWDCGTGNGQLAVLLSTHFDKVYATDLSEKQIQNATEKANIIYKVERAETTAFADEQFDLVTVAQAIHWFDFDMFYKEVKRTLKPDGVFAVIGYGSLTIDPETDKIIHEFYTNIIGSYWDKERRYIDEHYQTIPFPFKEITTPAFTIDYEWNIEQLTGYLQTWSAVQHYKKQNGTDPVELITEQLNDAWLKVQNKKVQFPILLRAAFK